MAAIHYNRFDSENVHGATNEKVQAVPVVVCWAAPTRCKGAGSATVPQTIEGIGAAHLKYMQKVHRNLVESNRP